jgi:hypothetical protein
VAASVGEGVGEELPLRLEAAEAVVGVEGVAEAVAAGDDPCPEIMVG